MTRIRINESWYELLPIAPKGYPHPCGLCGDKIPSRFMLTQHMVAEHGWREPGSVFSDMVYRDGSYWCDTCGDPVPGDDAFVAIIEGRTPEPCDYCGRVLVRIADDD